MINHRHGFYTTCMITFLRKRFIKNYEDINDPKVRIRHGIFVSIVGILLNTILVGLKLSAAFVLASNQGWIFSMALVGDAINNLGDLSSSLVSLIGFASSSKPADKEHPFGYRPGSGNQPDHPGAAGALQLREFQCRQGRPGVQDPRFL